MRAALATWVLERVHGLLAGAVVLFEQTADRLDVLRRATVARLDRERSRAPSPSSRRHD